MALVMFMDSGALTLQLHGSGLASLRLCAFALYLGYMVPVSSLCPYPGTFHLSVPSVPFVLSDTIRRKATEPESFDTRPNHVAPTGSRLYRRLATGESCQTGQNRRHSSGGRPARRGGLASRRPACRAAILQRRTCRAIAASEGGQGLPRQRFSQL